MKRLHRTLHGLVVTLAAVLATGCIETAVEATTIDLQVAGTEIEPFVGRNDALITLERADLAFGPVYLCAGEMAGALCEEALAEHLDATVINVLDPELRGVGKMRAITGTARSYMYDFGLPSLLTDDNSLVTDAAASLGNASVVVEGTAEVEGQVIPFAVSVRIEQGGDVEQGIPVVRSGDMDGFEGTIEPDDRSRLLVRFNAVSWLSSAAFRGLVEDASCTPDVSMACAGPIEQTCADDGTVEFTRDCAELGQACIRDMGCVERVQVDPESQIGRALRTGVTAGARPSFELQ